MQRYKPTTLRGHGRQISVDQPDDLESRGDQTERESWEDEDVDRQGLAFGDFVIYEIFTQI